MMGKYISVGHRKYMNPYLLLYIFPTISAIVLHGRSIWSEYKVKGA